MATMKTSQRKIEGERTKAKQVGELRQEIRQLKRTISRLQKQLDKRMTDPQPLEESPEVTTFAGPPVEIVVEVDPNACQNCGSLNLSSFKTPGGKILVGCRDCKAKL